MIQRFSVFSYISLDYLLRLRRRCRHESSSRRIFQASPSSSFRLLSSLYCACFDFLFRFYFVSLLSNAICIFFLYSRCFLYVYLFVRDRIYNSVADYNSSIVGVGCMSDVPFFLFNDGITFERFVLEG